MYPWLQPTFSQLNGRMAQNKLHHGILLSGVAGLGKSELAEQLAASILCSNRTADGPCGQCQSCKLIRAGSHPDRHELQSEKQIGVDAVRDAIQRLSATSQLSAAKVLIIYRADSMTESAANALLKTLEEPTANTYLILISDAVHRLLPTILSRCEKVNVKVPDSRVCRRWLAEQGFDQVPDQLLALYGNAPLPLLAELQNQEGLSYPQFNDSIDRLIDGQADPLQLANDWQDEGTKVVTWLSHWCKQQSLQTPANHQHLWQMYRQCVSANERLQHPGVNKSVIIAGLLQQLM